jgi:hypothetical protein
VSETIDKDEHIAAVEAIRAEYMGRYLGAEQRIKKLTEALERAIKVADEAREEWDKAPSGMRAGKILIALSGGCPGYRHDIDEIHAALRG